MSGRKSTKGRGKISGRGSGRKMHIENVDELLIREREIADDREKRARRRGEDATGEAGDEEEEDEEEEKEETLPVCFII
jgi:Ran GTPase-activating protein (RanGAP) involved in mRNA processing and transport